MTDGYESKGADIADDSVTVQLRFKSSEELDTDHLRAIDRHARSLLLSDRAITDERVKSIAHAEALFPHWRVDPDLALSGKIRVIHIENLDSNPCSGSHVGSTAEIGPFAMVGHRVDGVGNNVVSLTIKDAWSYWY
jgi:Ser-tRNA(Ala) deacylase AlaX